MSKLNSNISAQKLIKVKDIINNPNFDCNCKVEIYDGNEYAWNDGQNTKLWSSFEHDSFPDDDIMNRTISYMTIDAQRKCLIIESKTNT